MSRERLSFLLEKEIIENKNVILVDDIGHDWGAKPGNGQARFLPPGAVK